MFPSTHTARETRRQDSKKTNTTNQDRGIPSAPLRSITRPARESTVAKASALAVAAKTLGSPETGVGGCGAYRKALASLGTRSPRARSAAAVNPLRGSSATLRPSG